MAKQTSRSLNKYIADYDKLRAFLRYISYGCYHKKYLAHQLHQSARSYEDNWARVRFFLPEDRLQAVRQGHREIHSLKGDSYRSSFNDLARTYEIKTLTSSAAFALICILQIFSDSDEPLDEATLYQYELVPTDQEFPPQYEEISRSTLHRYLKELTEQGFLTCQSQNGRFRYELASNPLAALTAEEVSWLQDAIAFYRNISAVGIPGYFLSQTLQEMYPDVTLPALAAQFKHTTITRILDDDVVYALAYGIVHHMSVQFSYRKKKISAIPQRLVTDFETGRQYLLAVRKRRNISKQFTISQSFRVDLIQDMEMGEAVPLVPRLEETAPHDMQILFTYTDKASKKHLLYRIQEHAPTAVLEDDEQGTIRCTLSVVDDLKLMPWLRTFYPHVRIEKDGPAHLKERMRDDIEEALKNYGLCPTLS
ncbi:helix-turn-helix transcriptional regulator [Mitsuokella sp. WILCCON 0060]|uniref:helix-turn-helix transcriptional regulator n=1 Tax=unclassified Mitsuokella TaxID=2637239 RepID=UPI003F113D64